MTAHVIETVTFRLNDDVSREQFLTQSDAVATFLEECPGFVWTCSAWCELRNGFRVFRVDLIRQAGVVGNFEDESGRTLKDMPDARPATTMTGPDQPPSA